MSTITFRDYVSFRAIQISDKVKDYYTNVQPGSTVRPLRVKIAATHSGKITRNNGFYLPSEMRDGVPSWTDEYQKPILVHHDDYTDPIGRVISAAYVDISPKVRDSFNADSKLPILDQFIDGSLSFDDTVSFLKDKLLKDALIIDDPHYEGLGYIEITCEISNPEAIQKILDGRYLTGSVGASTNKAVCSVCKRDWAGEKGPCEHTPGKEYDSQKMVLIAGKLTYSEYSFVNHPADRHSKVIEISSIQDSVTNTTQFSLSDEEFLFSDMINNSTDILIEESEIPQEPKPMPESTDSLKVFWGDQYNLIVGDDSWGRQYAEMFFDAISTASDELKQVFQDAKLSAEARKKLSASTFCGPNRSYPVNDCAHAKAAMAYAKKYNESASVVSCIKRKAKRLGCPFEEEKKDLTNDIGRFAVDYFDRFEDFELVQLFNGLRLSMKERNLTDIECAAIAKQVADLEKQVADSSDSELTKKLTATQEELRLALEDQTKLQELNIAIVTKYRNSVLNQICSFQIAKDKNLVKETICDSFKDKSLEELENTLSEVSVIVDTAKPQDILANGTQTVVIGQVEDPTLKLDNALQQDKEAKQERRDFVVREYLRLLKVNRKLAEEYIEKERNSGLI